jgi:hypothetical protein
MAVSFELKYAMNSGVLEYGVHRMVTLEVKPYLGGKPNLEQCLLAQGRVTTLCGTLERE